MARKSVENTHANATPATYMTDSEAAEMLGVDITTIRSLIARGVLPVAAGKKVGEPRVYSVAVRELSDPLSLLSRAVNQAREDVASGDIEEVFENLLGGLDSYLERASSVSDRLKALATTEPAKPKKTGEPLELEESEEDTEPQASPRHAKSRKAPREKKQLFGKFMSAVKTA